MAARHIPGSAIVIIGATSGVGRATALSLAAHRADLVVVARNEIEIARLADECRRFGANVIGMTGDITEPADLERVAAAAVGTYGRIDTWINVAATLVVGELDEQPLADIRRVIDTNVWGTTISARTAMEQFKRQHDGVLIIVSSLLAIAPNPIAPSYSMTKFAVRGLGLSLHAAARRHPGIQVALILPGPIDSPMFRRAANHSGRSIRAIPPAFSPERVAAAIVRSVKRPHRQRTVGALGALIMVGHHVVPRIVETSVAAVAARLIFSGDSVAPTTGEPVATDHGLTTGGYRRSRTRVALGDGVGRWLARPRRRSMVDTVE